MSNKSIAEILELTPCNIPPREKKGGRKFVVKTGRTSYRDKHVLDWTWKDFLYYFNNEVERVLGIESPKFTNYTAGKYKGMIAHSLEERGPILFKNMIDWAIKHHSEFPQWQQFSIGLVCGTHSWATMIAEKAQDEFGAPDIWKEIFK